MQYASLATAGTGTLCELFDRTVAECGLQLALRSDAGSPALTWTEYADRAHAAAAGLAGLGIGRRDTVACWLRNRPEFNIADAGALRLGAIPFSLHQSYTVAQAEHVIGDARSSVLVTEPTFLSSALAVRDARRTPLETIVLVEGADACALTWQELLECASSAFDPNAAACLVEPDDLATLICAAGVEGLHAGARVSHRALVSVLAPLRDERLRSLAVRASTHASVAHLAVRLFTHYLPMTLGWSVTTCPEDRLHRGRWRPAGSGPYAHSNTNGRLTAARRGTSMTFLVRPLSEAA